MRNVLKFALLVLALGLFMRSSWVLSDEKCPECKAPQIDTEHFMKAHGIKNQENYSIWLKEHSVWRRTNEEELENYSFIPKQVEPERQ